MRIFIDDGSTNIKMLWEHDGETRTHISPNSFKRGWSATFGAGKPFNYVIDDEKYSYDLISPDVLPTNNVEWQYSPLNVLAVHHALLTSGIEPQEVEIVVTLPLAEFYDDDAQYNLDNIERKKASLMRPVTLNKGNVFTIKKVTVRPESIPAGIGLCDNLNPAHSVLIVDLGGTTLDVSMVAGQMTAVSRVFGDSNLGVSLVTREVRQALARANTETSNYNVDDPSAVGDVKKAIAASIDLLRTRVLDVIGDFKGYTHVMVIGGGAPLVADAIREQVNIRDDRFFVADDPQLALVHGLKAIG